MLVVAITLSKMMMTGTMTNLWFDDGFGDSYVMMIKLLMTTMIMTMRGMILESMLSILEMTHLVENTPKAKISVKLVTVIETPAC